MNRATEIMSEQNDEIICKDPLWIKMLALAQIVFIGYQDGLQEIFPLIVIVIIVFFLLSHDIVLYSDRLDVKFLFIKREYTLNQIYLIVAANMTIMVGKTFPYVTFIIPWRTNYRGFIQQLKSITPNRFR